MVFFLSFVRSRFANARILPQTLHNNQVSTLTIFFLSSMWIRMAAIRVILMGLAVTRCCARDRNAPHTRKTGGGKGGVATTMKTHTASPHIENWSGETKDCWVFNHLNKAGGSTVKHMLEPWIEKHNITVGLYDSTQWQQGEDFANGFLDGSSTVTWGAYTEGLRPYKRADGCKWFTIFRHPVPRLVSAYFYCKKSADSLCASVAMNATEASLAQFAKHWGNYGMRQFALAFVRPEDALATEFETCTTGVKGCPGWYKLKLYLDSLHSPHGDDGDGFSLELNDAAMYEMLEPIEEILSHAYTAVGILEDWETTTYLFNTALKLPGYDWPTGFHEIGKKNGNGKFHTEEQEALAMTWTDPDVRKYIWLDLLLYDHALAVHRRQVEEYGLA